MNWTDSTETKINAVFGADLTGTGLAGPLYAVITTTDPRYLAWYDALYTLGFLSGREVVPDNWAAPTGTQAG